MNAPKLLPFTESREDVHPAVIRAGVDRGLAIVAKMVRLQEELDLIETRLEAAGLAGEQVELNDPDREGRQYLARGSAKTVPVVFTADLLVGQFQADSEVHHRILSAFDPLNYHKLREFFRSVRVFKTLFDSGKKFRAHAAELLGKDAPTFISACLQRDKEDVPKSKTVVAWDRAAAIAEIPSSKSQAPNGSEALS
jgi:hypothetical protein